jgi:hypothetical protein
MAMAAYIIGMQKIASLAPPKKKRVVEEGFLEFFEDDGQPGSDSCFRRISTDKRASLQCLIS